MLLDICIMFLNPSLTFYFKMFNSSKAWVEALKEVFKV